MQQMICLCDFRTPRSSIISLERRGIEVLRLPPDIALPAPISGHTDLLVFILKNKLLTRESYYGKAYSVIDYICKRARLELVLSSESSGGAYPHDCGLCAAVSGKQIIYCEKSVDKSILLLAASHDYSLLKVSQGYAKCSCSMLADGAVITSDNGIAQKTRIAGIDTLSVAEGNIELPGYDHGFIGGASGLCENVLYFCGNIEAHPSYAEICRFAERHKTELISLSDEPLYDVGGLFFLPD